MSVRYTAHFQAQVWIDDEAIDVDDEGDPEWDCTEFVTMQPDLHDRIKAALGGENEIPREYLDRDDELIEDANAPAWAKEWGNKRPFVITVFKAD